MINDHPFGEKEKNVSSLVLQTLRKFNKPHKTLVSVQTVMGFHALEISFPLEYQPPHYRTKPASFLAHLIGHEGPGSLHSYLKNNHWVTSLSAGPQNLARGFAMFKITIHLTEEGLSESRFLVCN